MYIVYFAVIGITASLFVLLRGLQVARFAVKSGKTL